MRRMANDRIRSQYDAVMKTTRYFEGQVLRKRPYIRPEWCEQVLQNPTRREVQPDGRIRLRDYVLDIPTLMLYTRQVEAATCLEVSHGR